MEKKAVAFAKPMNERMPQAVAWAVMLLVSMLPNILFHEVVHRSPSWLFWAKVAFLLLLGLASWFWPWLTSLRPFFLILASIYLIEAGVSLVTGSTTWQRWFGGADAPFVVSMLGIQLGRLLVSFGMIGVLRVLHYRREAFFLVKGDLSAPIQPVRWLGFAKPEPWTRFGGQFAVYISLGTLLFLYLAGRPQALALIQALPWLPVVLLLAAMNAFSEEMTYRASLLAGLEQAVGSHQALWITAIFFGLGHYFGVPYGMIGVVMASFLGWILGKAMLETRGFFWAWFIHFLQDVMIFFFMAVGAVAPGG